MSISIFLKSAVLFSSLGVTAVIPLSFTYFPPWGPNIKERVWDLQNCTMDNWGSNNASVFKCFQNKDKTNWAFFLPVNWTRIFNNSSSSSSSSSSSVTGKENQTKTLTLKYGHKSLKFSPTEAEEEIFVDRIENPNGKIFAFKPSSLDSENQSIPNSQITRKLKGFEKEVENKLKIK